MRYEFCSKSKEGKSDQEMREDLLRTLIDRHLFTATYQLLNTNPDQLPMRELPPGNPASLYLLYLAYMRVDGQSSAASRTTFYKVWQDWSVCLKFRKKSDHAMCVQCSKLKAALHNAKVPNLIPNKQNWQQTF